MHRYFYVLLLVVLSNSADVVIYLHFYNAENDILILIKIIINYSSIVTPAFYFQQNQTPKSELVINFILFSVFMLYTISITLQ